MMRVRYSKLGRVRFVSHRDGARLWERALRRVGLPVAYTQGFTPRPKLSFGLALPTCAESVAEYLDVDLAADSSVAGDSAIVEELSAALPDGMTVELIAERELGGESLQESVTSSTWELWGDDITASGINSASRRLLGAGQVLVERERKGRRTVDDVRPLILGLRCREERLIADLRTVGRALRPAELATAAFPGIDALGVRVLRTHQWMTHDGERREVLSLPADVSAPDEMSSA